MSYNDKQYIDWLIDKLSMDDNSFRHSVIYKVLRDQLTIKGYWKAKQRGKPNVNNFIGKQVD